MFLRLRGFVGPTTTFVCISEHFSLPDIYSGLAKQAQFAQESANPRLCYLYLKLARRIADGHLEVMLEPLHNSFIRC